MYDSQDRVPRILPCGHTICESCLQLLRLYDSAGNLSPDSPQCPTCRSEITTASLSQLPKNFSLLDSQVRVKTIYCPLHGDQGLQALLFCLKCGVYVCHKCIATKHNAHQFEDLEKLSLRVKKNIYSAKENVRENRMKQESVLFNYKEKRKLLGSVMKRESLALKKYFDTLREQLNSEQETYEKQLELLYAKDLEDLDALIRLTEDHLRLIDKVSKRWTTLESSLETMSDKEILELDHGASQLSLLKIESSCLEFRFKPHYRLHWYQFLPRNKDFSVLDLGVIVQEVEGKDILCLGSSSLPGDEDANSWIYSVTENTWESVDMEIRLKAYSAACFLKEFQAVIVTGGRDLTVCKAVHILFPAMRKSDTRSSMLYARAGHGCVFYDNFLYAFGGFNEDFGTLNSCESCDFNNDTWEEKAHMNEKRALFGCSIWEKSVFVFGGFAKGYLDSIEKYSFASDKWSVLGVHLPAPCSGVAVCPYNSSLILIGGCQPQGPTNLSLQFDPTDLSLIPLGNLCIPRAFAKAFNLQGNIVVLGGSKGPICEQLTVDQWEIMKAASEPRVNIEKSICVVLG